MAATKYDSFYEAVVTDTEDKEKRGRIKLQIPAVLGEEAESAWALPIVQVAYDGGGDFCVPEVGDTVWVVFINGDANRPLWIGNWWSEEKSPLGSDYSRLDDTRIISYKDFKITIHEKEATIENCDGDNSIEMTSDGITVTCKDDSIELTGSGITISSGSSVTISAPTANVDAGAIYLGGGTPVARLGDAISHDQQKITEGSGVVFAG